MNYFIHVTDKADQDLGESFDYIDLILKNPLAADVLVDTAEKKLAQLSTFPKRYPVVRDPFLASLGIRFVPVQSYLAFYQVDEAVRRFFVNISERIFDCVFVHPNPCSQFVALEVS